MGSGRPSRNVILNFDKSNKFLLFPKFNEQRSNFLLSKLIPRKTALTVAPRKIAYLHGTLFAFDIFELSGGVKNETKG